MKRILFLLFFPTFISAQNKVDGLGPFKIGKTLCSKIPTFADTSEGRLRYSVSTYPKTQTWYAGYYMIAGMWIEDLTLVFYHDTLYFISCKGSDSLDLALHAKYGKGKISSPPDNIVTCRTGLKISYTEKEQRIYLEYPTTSAGMTATRLVGNYYNDNCEIKYYDSFEINNEKTSARVMKEYLNDKANEKKKQEHDINKKLNDF